MTAARDQRPTDRFPWNILNAVRLPDLPPRWDVWLGPDGSAWLVLLLVVPIFYVGFSLTVDVSAFGTPLFLYPWADNDYWWHLATGELILAKGDVPRLDPWLFTYGGEWIAHEWLADLVLALIQRAGGYRAAILFTWLAAVLGFWCLNLALRAYGARWRSCFFLSVGFLGVFLRDGVIRVRPQMWAFTCFAVLFLVLALHQTGRARRLWLVPPLFLVWFNVHLSAVIGLSCLAAFAADQLVRRRDLVHVSIVTLASGATAMINPYGALGVRRAVEAYLHRSPAWAVRILEWQPPDFSLPHNWPFALALPMGLIALWQLTRLRVWPALPLVAALYQGLQSVRFVVIYALLTVLNGGVLAWQRDHDERSGGVSPTPLVPREPWLVALVMGAVAIVLLVATLSPRTQFRPEAVAWSYPVKAADAVLERAPQARIFNAYGFGGYLNHRFKGRPQIFIDGRTEMYPDELLQRYFRILDGEDGWERDFEMEHISIVMIRPGDGLALKLAHHAGWRMGFANDFSVTFVRNERP